MTPAEVVDHVAALVTADGELSEDEIFAAMAKAGVPDDIADRAYKFTQIAWARVVLAGLGVKLPSEYYCLNASGEIIDSGELAEEAFFVAATDVAEQYGASKGFARFAAMSADVDGVNKALHAGKKPENLLVAPPALFLEAPTPEGIANAKREIGRRLDAARGGAKTAATKAWWQFWR